MVKEALDFLRIELDSYLNLKTLQNTEWVSLENVAFINDGNANSESKSKIILSLVNVEEDNVMKQQENFSRAEGRILYKNPKIFLNLFILFTTNATSYPDSLKKLSMVMQFFQANPAFDSLTSPNLDAKIEKLLVKMHSLSFEQLNHLWGVLGGKYMPSVLYKVTQVVIDEDATSGEAAYIKEIQIGEKMKKIVSS